MVKPPITIQKRLSEFPKGQALEFSVKSCVPYESGRARIHHIITSRWQRTAFTRGSYVWEGLPGPG